MPDIFTFAQHSDEWWAARRGLPTASEFDKLVTPKTWAKSSQADAYAWQLVADLYDPNYGKQETYVSAAMLQGTIMEPEARRFVEFECGHRVRQVGFVLSDCGRYGCSPDGLIGDEGALELKCPQLTQHVRNVVENGIPHQYLPQCHGVLLATGREWIDFVSYSPAFIPFPCFRQRLTRDERTDALKAILDEFLDKLASLKEKAAKVFGPINTG